MLVISNEMSVIDLFLIGYISRDFFCFLLNPLQLIHSLLETQCARLRPSQCWSGGRRISSHALRVTFLFIHPRNVSFFARGWHCGLEFSLSFTITSSSFLQYCSIVIMLHSLSLWLFIYVGQSINLVVVFSSDCAAAPSCLRLRHMRWFTTCSYHFTLQVPREGTEPGQSSWSIASQTRPFPPSEQQYQKEPETKKPIIIIINNFKGKPKQWWRLILVSLACYCSVLLTGICSVRTGTQKMIMTKFSYGTLSRTEVTQSMFLRFLIIATEIK